MEEKEFKERLKREIEFYKEGHNSISLFLDLVPLISDKNFTDIEDKLCDYRNIPNELVDEYIENAWILYKNEKIIEEKTGKKYIEIEAIREFEEEDYKVKAHIGRTLGIPALSLPLVAVGLILVLLTKGTNENLNSFVAFMSIAPTITGLMLGLRPYALVKDCISLQKAKQVLKNLGIVKETKELLKAEDTDYNIVNKGMVK